MESLSRLILAAFVFGQSTEQTPIALDSRLEIFVDRYCIEKLENAALVLHSPCPAEKAIQFDRDWEGRYCGYVTVIKDTDVFRMYYRGLPVSGKDGQNAEVTCYAESRDGIHWTKPDLGIYEIDGTRNNNVILAGMSPFSHNFAPFIDTRPGVNPKQRFKAVAGTEASGLKAFVSEDGIHWELVTDEPLIKEGAFDSQNVVFWSETEQAYCCYFRTWQDKIRRVSRCVSQDFLHWSTPELMEYSRGPLEHLYTNQTLPYFRAPHIYIGLAARFMPGRRVIDAEHATQYGVEEKYSDDCSDAVLISSRGGNLYDRTFMEAFIRPGYGLSNWTSRTNYPAYGIVQTGPAELSVYVQRNYGQPGHFLERLRLRLDGFASVRAPYDGGVMLTRPLRFLGKSLYLNYSTSAAGQIQVEILDEAAKPIPGYAAADCDLLIGDEIDRKVTWKKNDDLTTLQGKTIQLRFIMKDADLFALQFR